MQFSTILSTLALTATTIAAPVGFTKRSSGSAIIYNNCAFPINVNPCYSGSSNENTKIEAGSSWTQELLTFGGFGQGVSLKLSSLAENAPSGVAQLEYTVNPAMAVTFWDLSLIDGNPFGAFEQQVINSGGNVLCAAGVGSCKDAYMTPTDNWATRGTAMGTDLEYYICGGAPETSN